MVTRVSRGRRETRGRLVCQGYQVSQGDKDWWDPKERRCLVLQAALGFQAHLVSQAMGDLVLLGLLGHPGLQDPLDHPQDSAQQLSPLPDHLDLRDRLDLLDRLAAEHL